MADDKVILGLSLTINELKAEFHEIKNNLPSMVDEVTKPLREELKAAINYSKQQEIAHKEEVKGLHAEIKQLNILYKKVKDLDAKITFYGKGSNVKKREDLSPKEEIRAFWGLTPKQHGVSQMILLEWINRDIAERMGLTEAAVKSHIHQICNSLGVKNRNVLRDLYCHILEGASAKEYTDRTKIIKTWASRYGSMTYQKAKTDDPYFEVVCVTRYRRPDRKGIENVLFEVETQS